MNTSNSTQNDATKKTAWARSTVIALAIAIAATVAIIATLWVWLLSKNDVMATLGDTEFALRIADTPSALERGLSGVTYLPSNRGMLFVFDRNERWSIWMKDMHIDIDIIWLDADKRVVWIVENATPESYPQSFKTDSDARYVVELPAGSVQRANITTGSHAAFALP